MGDLCRQQNIILIPLACESFGGWDKSAAKELKRIGQAKARRNGTDEGEEASWFFQRLSLCLAKDNSALLMNRDPALVL